MKPFDLDAALAGESVVARSGEPVVIVAHTLVPTDPGDHLIYTVGGGLFTAQVMCILREAGPTWGQRILYQVDGFHFSVDDAGKRSTDKDSEYDLQMVDGARS